MDKYILITGGAGYIGSHTNKLFAKNGYKTLVVDNLENGFQELVKYGVLEVGDLRDMEFVEKIFNMYAIEAVIHFAAYAYVGESVSNPMKYYENNLLTVMNLLKVMKRNGVDSFIFSSTCATYGLPEYMPIDENHHQNPINPYGKSKLFAENIIKDFANVSKIKYCILRYFNASGADIECELGEKHNPETHLIPLVIDAVLGIREAITVYGTDYDTPDGTCIRDYIHVEDLANAHFLALDFIQNNGSEIFNLGVGFGYSVQEIISLVEKVSGKKVNVKIGKRRKGDPDKLIADFKKAKKLLKWCPRYNIEDIINSAYEWHRLQYEK